jgi:hypothetical protein
MLEMVMKLLVGTEEGHNSREQMAASFHLSAQGERALGCVFACCWRGKERVRVLGGVGSERRVLGHLHIGIGAQDARPARWGHSLRMAAMHRAHVARWGIFTNWWRATTGSA